jgi:hypothetical protein
VQIAEAALRRTPLEHCREDPMGPYVGQAFTTGVPCFVVLSVVGYMGLVMKYIKR